MTFGCAGSGTTGPASSGSRVSWTTTHCASSNPTNLQTRSAPFSSSRMSPIRSGCSESRRAAQAAYRPGASIRPLSVVSRWRTWLVPEVCGADRNCWSCESRSRWILNEGIRAILRRGGPLRIRPAQGDPAPHGHGIPEHRLPDRPQILGGYDQPDLDAAGRLRRPGQYNPARPRDGAQRRGWGPVENVDGDNLAGAHFGRAPQRQRPQQSTIHVEFRPQPDRRIAERHGAGGGEVLPRDL